ncbi:MAG: hypothetical protein GY708_12715 [Actinomycetia bacterium]|nr:hypothetical protein [Actinomycetes bacterium]
MWPRVAVAIGACFGMLAIGCSSPEPSAPSEDTLRPADVLEEMHFVLERNGVLEACPYSAGVVVYETCPPGCGANNVGIVRLSGLSADDLSQGFLECEPDQPPIYGGMKLWGHWLDVDVFEVSRVDSLVVGRSSNGTEIWGSP